MLTRKYQYPSYVTGTSHCSLYHNWNLHIVYRKVHDIFLFLCTSFLLMGDVNKKRSSTPDVLRSRSRMSSDSSRNDPSESFSMADTLSQQSDQSPMVSNFTIDWKLCCAEPEAPNLQIENMLCAAWSGLSHASGSGDMSMQQCWNVNGNLIQCYFINSCDITCVWIIDFVMRNQHLINLTFYVYNLHHQSTFLRVAIQTSYVAEWQDSCLTEDSARAG
jgi:hypothetical protein